MRYFYYNPIKPLLIILFASLAFIILQPILVAHADEVTSRSIRGGTVICNPEYGNYPKTPQGEESKDDGWWWCYSGKSSHRVSYDGLKCDSGYKAESREAQGSIPKEGPYSQGRCVELSKEEQVEIARKKAEIDAATNQVTMPNLEEALKPTITNSSWYKELSDSEKFEAGCATIGDSISCDQNATSKIVKKLIGTCIVAAEKSVSSRKYGDTTTSAKDQYFTDCVSGRGGIDKAQVTQNMTTIAWDDVKKEMDTAAQEAENALNKPEEGGEEEKNSCGVDGIGWFICPLMNFASNISDSAYSAISQFLSIDPKIFKNDSTSGGLKQAWNFFRDIANAVFAVIFLWVIFSQISNVGVSNYGIKKILPRLIIGALLVNLSFYLCQLAVDLSNILGFSLKGVLEGAASGIDTQSAAAGSFYTAVAGALALTGAALFLFLAVSIPTITALLLALLVVLVILIVRQAAIILLIAVSPLAFAAWLLPNTENLFKKWTSMFKGLLVVFPVVSLLYGAGKLAGAILAASATDDPNNPKETMQFAALAASILPLGATPFVLKSSLNSLGSFAGKLGGLSGLANKKLGSTIANKSKINDVKNAWKSRSARKLAERRSGNTLWGRGARKLRKSNSILMKGLGVAMNPAAALDIDNSWAGKKIGLSDGARAAQEAYDKSAMEKAERSITYKYGGDAEAALKDKKADKYTRIAAVNQLKGQGAHGADVVADYLRNGGEVDSVSMANALTEMKGSHAGVSEAGVSALKALQGGQSSFSLGDKDSSGNVVGDSAKDEFNSLTKDGVRKLSNEAIAKQSADAIKHSAIKRNDALRLLKDDRLRSMMSQDTKNALVNK